MSAEPRDQHMRVESYGEHVIVYDQGPTGWSAYEDCERLIWPKQTLLVCHPGTPGSRGCDLTAKARGSPGPAPLSMNDVLLARPAHLSLT